MAELALTGTARGRALAQAPRLRSIALALGVVYLLRVAVMLASGAGLHVDEAQYWEWSRALQWGYWSKPPGVAALIAASTALLGDDLLGVRWLGMACWPAAALVLAALAGRMGGAAAAAWAAALFIATPAAGLLGLVVTTDGPLMLCWALTLAAVWQALQAPAAGRAAWPWWCVAGLVAGLGLLAKYTMAALLLSALAWAPRWLRGSAPDRLAVRRQLAGVALAALLAALVLAPNLLWNALQGWPTLRHTAALTAAAAPQAGRSAGASLLEFMLGQALLLGPAALAVAVLLWRRRGALAASRAQGTPGKPGHAAQQALLGKGEHFALAAALPLLLLGALQALHAKAQMNWTAPALLGLCLWLALRAARTGLGWRALAFSTAVGLAIPLLLALAGTLAPALAGQRADVWARMRGWHEALAPLRPALLGHPDLPLAATERDVLVQAAYAWRDLPRNIRAWPADGPPQHHYAQFHALAAPGEPWPPAVLVLLADEPDATMRAAYPRWQRLAGAQAATGRHLSLWWAGRAEAGAPR